MTYKPIALLIAALFAFDTCIAQLEKAIEDFKPSSVNQAGKPYPQVNSEGRVRVSISAPEANRVQLNIDCASVPDPGSMYFYGAVLRTRPVGRHKEKPTLFLTT
jgi:hypothetical protein